MITHIFIVYTKNTHEQRNRNESVLIINHAKKRTSGTKLEKVGTLYLRKLHRSMLCCVIRKRY